MVNWTQLTRGSDGMPHSERTGAGMSQSRKRERTGLCSTQIVAGLVYVI